MPIKFPEVTMNFADEKKRRELPIVRNYQKVVLFGVASNER